MRLKLLFLMLVQASLSMAQERTLGLLQYEEDSYNGITLFRPNFGTDVFMIDNCGRLINEWESDLLPGNSVYFTEDGNLLKTVKTSLTSNPNFVQGGAGESLQLLDWNNNLVWEYTYSNEDHRMHHDVALLPNNNVLILAWELISEEEAIAAGRNPDLLKDGVMWGEHIVEVNPSTDEIVWEWHMWDHIVQDIDDTKENFGVVADHPELIDVNFTAGGTADGGKNWMQLNAMDYNPTMDQIMLTSPFISEIYIIDHSTTTEEAASHTGGNSGSGGDILYRWGNPQVYDHGTADDQKLFFPHNGHWIEPGLPDGEKIMILNNGQGRPAGNFSTVEIIEPAMDDYYAGTYIYVPGRSYGPDTPDWTYTADPATDFFTSFIGSAQRLPNGNTLICEGANGRFFEINENEEIVWEYLSPVINTGPLNQGDTIPKLNGRNANIVFRTLRYSEDYSGFDGLDLTAGVEVESNPLASECEIFVVSSLGDLSSATLQIYPNPAHNRLQVRTEELTSEIGINLFDLAGNKILAAKLISGQSDLDISGLKSGVYVLKVGDSSRKIVIER
ncbi:MAG: aryl-sulfate sulfotransferase [Cyclobacteriaceae bacterium]